MKKIILIFMIFFLTSCKDYKEINDLAIITGIAIDYIDNNYILNTEVIINDTKSETKTYKTNGKTIEEAISKISNITNKELFKSRIKVILITENIIKNNINFYDYFLRDSKGKIDYKIFIIESNDIDNIFKINNSSYIEKLLITNKDTLSSTVSLDLTNYIYKTYEKDYEIVYPTLKIINNEIILSNLITYKNNNKTILNETESIFYNILTNNIETTYLTIPCNNNYFTIEINKSKTKYNYQNNIFNIETKLNGKIKNYTCEYKINIDSINKINKQIEEYTKDNINNLINIVKTSKNDFIGIGNYLYKHNKYKNNYLNNINIKTNIDINITSIGEITNE